MAELYEKRALTAGDKVHLGHLFGGAALGGLGAGAYGYWANKDNPNDKEKWERVGNTAGAGAIGGGLLGLMTGAAHSGYLEAQAASAASKARAAARERLWSQPPSDPFDPANKSVYDTAYGPGHWEDQYGPESYNYQKRERDRQYNTWRAHVDGTSESDRYAAPEGSPFRAAYEGIYGKGSWDRRYGPKAKAEADARNKARTDWWDQWHKDRAKDRAEEAAWWENFNNERVRWDSSWSDREHAGGGGAADSSRAWAPDPSRAWTASARSAHDPAHHGKAIGRMWDTIVGSKELDDLGKRESAIEFMKTVGRESARPERLQAIMQQHPGDTLTGQMMNILFHKFHGSAKTAAYHEGAFAVLDVFGMLPIWSRRWR